MPRARTPFCPPFGVTLDRPSKPPEKRFTQGVRRLSHFLESVCLLASFQPFAPPRHVLVSLDVAESLRKSHYVSGVVGTVAGALVPSRKGSRSTGCSAWSGTLLAALELVPPCAAPGWRRTQGQRDEACFPGAAMYDLGRARGFLAPARTGVPRQASRCQRTRDLFGPLSLGDWWNCH